MSDTVERASLDPMRRPVTALIGADVTGVDLHDPPDPPTVARLCVALLRCQVLFFRDQPIDDGKHIRFTRYFGPSRPSSRHQRAPRLPEIMVNKLHGGDHEYRPYRLPVDHPLQRLRAPAPATVGIETSRSWQIPPQAPFLRGVEISAHGSDTIRTDLDALYDGLSPNLHQFLNGLQAIHVRDDAANGSPPPPRLDGCSAGPFASPHPLARAHSATGRRLLFPGTGCIPAIDGLSPNENTNLLDHPNAEPSGHAVYQVRLRCSPIAMAVWHDRNVSHVGRVDGPRVRDQRIVHRTTGGGEVRVGPGGSRSRLLAGELFIVIS